MSPSTTTQRTCPDCGIQVRPSNLRRHRRARHFPRAVATSWGTRYTVPAVPIKANKDDRRYDEIAPRGEGPHRYRIYRLRAGELELLATAPDAECMGLGVVTLHAEGEFISDDSVGVLDTSTEPGHWVVHPFALGRKRS